MFTGVAWEPERAVCLPAEKERYKEEIGRIHELGDGDLPGKFRLGDIRAERYSLHSHAEHHCH